MPSTDTVIHVRDLSTRFGDTLVHENLNLEIRRGEIVGIVGGSGSGKTVLLREILQLHTPTTGTIELLGHDARHQGMAVQRRLRTRIGVMFQHGALFTGMTVQENVMLPLQEHTRLNRTLIAELAMIRIRMAGLPAEAASRYPAELSGGMIKRAALARALAMDPELLFLDEPTSGLDPVSAAAFDDLLLELKSLLRLTVVMITHDPDSLWRTTDRVAFLAQRRVVMVAPIAELAASAQADVQRYFQGPRTRDRRRS
ncbi:MAG: ATP-binding cassette domain-containing protein [Aquisalimonadaceae bacterium]